VTHENTNGGVKYAAVLPYRPLPPSGSSAPACRGWYIEHAYLMYPLGNVVGEFLATFKESPRMKAGFWDMGKALEALQIPHNR